ncbi:S8 family peptidase [Enterocloster bolteae]|uniref:S8 family peptidase n=1 Tax=Enterocloster bolteae TaxID=208479 RepID=UPI002676EFC5|nr:S8 family peptidase [Enterocloster bolteae]
MDNQKRENLLNLALDATEEERLKSVNLNVGYDPGEKTWELIVRYNGSLESLRDEGIRVDELAAGYAVLVVPESRIEQVSAMEQIVYIEKPKRLFFASNMARAASCLSTIQTSIGAGAGGGGTGGAGGGVISSLESGLTGKGVLVAVIDSGIDYFHPDFRNPDGTTRIGLLADQDRDRIYTREEINAALETGSRTSALALVPSTDPSGHGTAVAAIAAGNGREGNGVYRGVAYESELMVVKLGTPLTDSFPRTTQLMKALDLVVRRAQDMNRPLAVNISFGNTYGSHDGTSLLETFINDMSGIGRNVIVAGTGNEGTGAGHRAGSLVMGQEENAQLSIAPYETGMGVQLWKSYVDQFSIRLVTPSGEIIGPIDSRLGPQTLRYGGTQILIYYGKPSPFSRAQEIYFDFLPVRDYLDSGIWTFRLTPERIVTGRYDMWLPSRGILNPSTRFLRPVPETTLTIPSTASNVISVGAYDDSYRAYADFSGRGFTRQTGQVKPDLAAPGVDIVTARRGGGYEAVTGTSFAAPFVTGSAALLMQWGILQGNDPFLYGEKVKAYFTRGARHLPGYDVWPNERLGYGTLCVRDSLPLGNS